MNDHVLTINATAPGQIYLGNLTIEGGGELCLNSGGYFGLGGNQSGYSGKFVRGETTTLRVKGGVLHDYGGEHVFGSYVSEIGASVQDDPNTVIKVLDRFVPGVKWHATELRDGATLDLSANEGLWNMTNVIIVPGATIFVDLGERKVKSSEPVVTWGAKPANVKFRAVPGAAGSFTAKDNGLYWRIGFSVIVR